VLHFLSQVDRKMIPFDSTMSEGGFVSNRHVKTLSDIFKTPPLSNVLWADCEKLLRSLGAEFSEGEGSRVRIVFEWGKGGFSQAASKKGN
jgi:hypothetical protein